ncbi:MAG: right-handed parallel beta-helix repeat-containing protein [Muribaculaceae bacterium]
MKLNDLLIKCFCLALLMLMCINAEGAETVKIYVSDGAVGGNGSSQSPYATLHEAANQLQRLRSQGNMQAVDILVSPGVYEADSTLLFTNAHNTPECGVVTIKPSSGDGKVVLSGGRHITNWQEIAPGHWVAQLPQVKNGSWYFRQLFAGHKRLTRARTPNKGFYTTQGGLKTIFQEGGVVSNDQSAKDARHWLSRCGFAYRDHDIDYWNDWKNAEVLTFHSWECSWQSILSVDTARHEVYFCSPCRYPVGFFGQNMRYRIENIRQALDEPGEWFLDRESGMLHLLLNRGENPAEMQIYAPRLDNLLQCSGTPQQAVANIRFESIDFQYTAYRMGLYDIAPNWPSEVQKSVPFFPSDLRAGFTGSQAAPTAGASLNFTYAKDVEFMTCGMRHMGAIGVSIAHGCNGVSLTGCEIADAGAGGVYIGFDVRLVDEAGIAPSEAPCNNVVSNCLITRLGSVHPAAVGVWMAQTSGNKIVNNELSYISYSGISTGWTWGFEHNFTKNNYIAHNHIHHVAQILGDAAGMYSLGDCDGTVYDANYIDQIFKGEGVHGVVDAMGFDECSSKITIRNNVVGKVSGKVASFGRQSSAELQKWENNNFDMYVPRPVIDHKPSLEPEKFTVHVRFHPHSTFLNLSGWHEQRWLMRKNGGMDTPGAYGMFIQGKQAVAYLNVGGDAGKVQLMSQSNVVNDDCDNTATLTYDGETLRFYFNEKLVDEKKVGQERVKGTGKLEIAPIAANSLRNGIEELCIINGAVSPAAVKTSTKAFSWKAKRQRKGSINVEKVIREAGPAKEYEKNFVMRMQ